MAAGSSDQESAPQKSESSSGNGLLEFGFAAGIFDTLLRDVDVEFAGADLNPAAQKSESSSGKGL